MNTHGEEMWVNEDENHTIMQKNKQKHNEKLAIKKISVLTANAEEMEVS